MGKHVTNSHFGKSNVEDTKFFSWSDLNTSKITGWVCLY